MEQPLDALARALANGEISRRKALRRLGGALFGAALASLGIGCDSDSPTAPATTGPELAKIGCKANGKKCRSGGQCCSGNCVGGQCTECPAGQSICGSGCCPDGQCCNGQCCSAGFLCVSGVCVNPCSFPCNPCGPPLPCNVCALAAPTRRGGTRGPAGLARGKLKTRPRK